MQLLNKYSKFLELPGLTSKLKASGDVYTMPCGTCTRLYKCQRLTINVENFPLCTHNSLF